MSRTGWLPRQGENLFLSIKFRFGEFKWNPLYSPTVRISSALYPSKCAAQRCRWSRLPATHALRDGGKRTLYPMKGAGLYGNNPLLFSMDPRARCFILNPLRMDRLRSGKKSLGKLRRDEEGVDHPGRSKELPT